MVSELVSHSEYYLELRREYLMEFVSGFLLVSQLGSLKAMLPVLS
jgi:hypothetical protein